MSKKRSSSRSLKAAIEQQLAAAAQEIFWLLQERRQAEPEQLRGLLTERITAAVELILTAFEASRGAERELQKSGESSGAEPAAERRGASLN